MIVLGALITGTTIYANGSTDLPSERPGKTTRITFDNVNKGARLYVKDSQGFTLFSERIAIEGSYARSFDLSKLPEGEYYFEVDKKGFIDVFPFSVTTSSIEMISTLRQVIAKPSVKVNNKMVYVRGNGPEDQSLEIEIHYEGDELVYTEHLSGRGDITRAYDFSTSVGGDYLYTIKSQGRTFNEMVHIRD